METLFQTTLFLDSSDEPLDVVVSYEMRDLGVMGHRNERVRPVIQEVLILASPSGPSIDILYQLSDDQIEKLERKAAEYEEKLVELEKL